MKVVTLVTGKVPPSKRGQFEAAYRSTKLSGNPLPQGLEMSLLLRGTDDQEKYVIETVWSSRDALQAMRSSEKPRAIALFEEVGVSPTVEIVEVAETVP